MTYEVYLAHHGILGQRWGVRRFQNPDGSLTEAGRRRYRLDKNAAGVYAYVSKRTGDKLTIPEKVRDTQTIRKAQKNELGDSDLHKLEYAVRDITPNILADDLERQKTGLLLDYKEDWISALETKKRV